MSEPAYVAQNRDLWAKSNAEYTDREADRVWRTDEITWGMFGTTDSDDVNCRSSSASSRSR